MRDLKKLEKEPESYWIKLLKKYFVDAPMIVTKGIPSIEKQRALTQEEEQRTAKQIEKLGSDGLERKKLELQKAIEKNEVRIEMYHNEHREYLCDQTSYTQHMSLFNFCYH